MASASIQRLLQGQGQRFILNMAQGILEEDTRSQKSGGCPWLNCSLQACPHLALPKTLGGSRTPSPGEDSRGHLAWREGPGPVLLVPPIKLPPMSCQTPLSRRGALFVQPRHPRVPQGSIKGSRPLSFLGGTSLCIHPGTHPGPLGILSLNCPQAQMATATCPWAPPQKTGRDAFVGLP